MPDPTQPPVPRLNGIGDVPNDAPKLEDITVGFSQLGQTGLKRYGGFISEETHPKLNGQKASKVYREMSENDGTVGAVLFAIESLVRQVEWRIEQKDEAPASVDAATFIDECMEDMEHTWEELLSEILSMVPFGFAPCEPVYKKRVGPDETDPRFKSDFKDGKIGWRKIALRGQETVWRWAFREDGTLEGLWQMAPPTFREVFIPAAKLILFRPKAPRNNPEGRSMLRNAFRDWSFKKRLEEIEAIGIERDLSGLPTIEVPPEWLMPEATVGQKALVEDLRLLVQQVRRDEREGVVIPAEEISRPGKDGAPVVMKTGIKFRLMTTGGRRAIDLGPAIDRHDHKIAMTLLSEFLFLGTGSTGSWALADAKTELLAKALGALLDSISTTFTRYGIHPLMELNGVPRENWPSLVHGDVSPPDLEKLGAFISTLTTSGLLTPDRATERKMREVANLPEQEDEPVIARTPPPVPGDAVPVDGQPPPPPAHETVSDPVGSAPA